MKTTRKTSVLRPLESVGSLKSNALHLLCGLALALSLFVQPAIAAVTVQGWWHMDSSQPIADSSGNNRGFRSAFSTRPNAGGQYAGLLVNNGAGGPLGTSGYTSAQCVQVGVGIGGKRQSAMWDIGYNPPATNYGIEIWVMPQDNGIAGGSGGWLLSSGESGGVALRINAPGGTDSYIDAFILGSGTTIGDQVLIDTNRWMHLALVVENDVVTFYTNGVACGASVAGGLTTPAGAVYCGTPSDNQAYYGFLDEARMFTFASGAFSTNDLLLHPPGPNLIGQPQNAIVWNGGAVPFNVTAAFDNSLQYQWRSGGTDLSGKTDARLYFNTVALADSGSSYDCVVTLNNLSRTSSVANLTVVAANPANISAYRNAINAEPSLVAYFPVDGDTATTLTNTKDGTHNGTLELGTTYDGRTNDTFGARSLSFALDGDVQIPNNSAFEFSGGAGTIEALVYLSQATPTDPTIFAEAFDGGSAYYVLGASATGSSITYSNDVAGALSWIVPGGLIGKLTHVALVFSGGGGNITAYANGQNLGTKVQAGFGSGGGSPAWIGGLGTSVSDYRWAGSVDELAVYSSALSETTIQTHYSKFFYGTNTAGPSIVSQPSSKTLLAGGAPALFVQAAGTLPLSYIWTTNGVPVPGGTTPTLVLPPAPAGSSISCSLAVHNLYGDTNTQPIVLNFVAPPAGYATTVMNHKPSGFWRLADASGSPAVDSAGMNDGTYSVTGVTNGVPSIPGESGTATTFNGSGGRAVVPYTSVLNPNNPFTVDFWVKLNAYGFYVPVSSMNRPARDGGYEFYLNGNSAGYEWHSAAGGGYNMLTASSTAPAVGNWYHVAGVYDGKSLLFYVNGDPAELYIDNPDLEEGGLTFAPNVVKGFYIGSRSTDSQYFNGTMADVAFYNYALSQDQLRKHVFAGLAAPIQMTAPSRDTNIVVDSKPAGSPHGGINKGATWVASSSDGSKVRSGVMQFDGAAGNQITLAANPDFDSPVGTIMFWIKSAGTVPPGSGGAMLFDRRYNFPNFGSFGDVIVQQDGGTIGVQPQYWGANVLSTSLSGGYVSDSLWHHVAYVYDQSTTGSITLYVDGTQVGSGTYNAAYAWAWPAAQQIELGQSHDTFWERFDGQMDDVRFYSRMLTDPEVASVYSSDALVDPTSLKVRLNFDAAPGGWGVSWSPSVAVSQTAGAVNGPYVDQATSRTPLLVPRTSTNGFFRAKSP